MQETDAAGSLESKKLESIRLGIIGTGRITKRFVPEMESVSGTVPVMVYNPHISSAERFARTFGIAGYTDNWEQFCDAVDSAYVAAPHETHYQYTKNLLLKGKHVLCEKPLCFSGRQTEELFEMAEKRGLVLMEAIKTAYCPGFQELLKTARSGIIGEIKDVEACFTKLTDVNGRELCSEACGGSFYELGSYVLLPIVKLLGTPKEVCFQSIRTGKNQADGFTKAHLIYEDAFALAKTGLTVKSEGALIISGTKGYILAESPWWLTRRFQVRFEDCSADKVYTFPFEGQGLRYEIKAFMECIEKLENDGKCMEMALMPEDSVRIAEIMEAFEKTLPCKPL